MKVRELAKKNRGEGVRYSFKLYTGAQLELNQYSILHIYYYLMNIVVTLPAILRHSPPFFAHRRLAQFFITTFFF